MSIVTATFVLHFLDNDNDVEVLYAKAYSPIPEIQNWVDEEIQHYGTDNLLHEIGQYTEGTCVQVSGVFRLVSGKDSDTPNGPGEYWSYMEPVGKLHVMSLTEKEVNEIVKNDQVEPSEETQRYPNVNIPELHSKWRNQNGDIYTVIGCSQRLGTDHEQYPITVYYKIRPDYAGACPLNHWHSSMTLISNSGL